MGVLQKNLCSGFDETKQNKRGYNLPVYEISIYVLKSVMLGGC